VERHGDEDLNAQKKNGEILMINMVYDEAAFDIRVKEGYYQPGHV